MKLSYRNYPILQMLDKEYCSGIEVVKREGQDDFTRNYANKCIQGSYFCNLPVYYISKEFHNAVYQNREKLWNTIKKDFDLVKELCQPGVVIYPSGDVCIFHRDKTGDNQIFIVATKGGKLYDVRVGNWTHSRHLCQDNETKEYTSKFLTKYELIMAFKKFATVELEIINPHKKTKSNIDKQGKVINDTGVEVTMLDSRWFREIIRNEGFKVRGHFRLQPYKNEHGEWTHRFIYIEEFEKHGYHRRAKMLIEND